MLYYRALGFHLDEVYPDVMVGFVIAEVLDDYPAPDEREVKGVTLAKVEPRSNDPILDLLPPGAKAEDLERELEKQVSKNCTECGGAGCEACFENPPCEHPPIDGESPRDRFDRLSACDTCHGLGDPHSDYVPEDMSLTQEVQDPFEDDATITVPQGAQTVTDPPTEPEPEEPVMSQEKRATTLRRLAAQDAAQEPADTDNSAPEGHVQDELAL